MPTCRRISRRCTASTSAPWTTTTAPSSPGSRRRRNQENGDLPMITRNVKRLSLRALIVDDELGTHTAEGRAARALVTEMQGRNIEVVEALSAEDGQSVITSDSAIHALLIDWSLGDDKNHARSRGLIEYVRSRNDKIPIFLLAERGEASSIPVDRKSVV